MEQEDINRLADAIILKMTSSHHTLWLDPETHSAQHKFISEMIAERREKAARRERLAEKIAGSIVLSAILVVIGLVGAGVLTWLREHL